MRLSQLFGKTLRQAPAEAETIGHQLLLRAALVQQLSAGVYSSLPLGWERRMWCLTVLRGRF